MKILSLIALLGFAQLLVAQTNRQIRRAQFHCSHGHCNENRQNILSAVNGEGELMEGDLDTVGGYAAGEVWAISKGSTIPSQALMGTSEGEEASGFSEDSETVEAFDK